MTDNSKYKFTKTKILATLGPAVNNTEMISKLISAGIDGIRLNFSHGDYSFYKKIYEDVYSACLNEKTPLSILIDLQGPKIRIGELKEPQYELNTGDTFEITIDDLPGTNEIVSTSYKSLVDDAKVGDPILIDDGLIRLRIRERKERSVVCFIENGGTLKPKKGMNLPGMKLSTPSITKKDFADLEFALENRVDYVALSFVRSPNDIVQLRDWMKKRNKVRPIIAKIEKKEAVENFDAILEEADGIMIARGDLGVELEPQEVPIIQKEIIHKCNDVGKLVITATQMLESMIHNPIPTRAEASDVANAVWDGTDVVMLSGETSVGKFPIKTVQMMNDVINMAEVKGPGCKEHGFPIPQLIEDNLFDSVGRAIVSISKQIKAEAIVVFTFGGKTAINISKYRPDAKIIALSNSFETMNFLSLRWGVTSIYCAEIDKEHIIIDLAKKLIKEAGLVKDGDVVIFTAGTPFSNTSRQNWLRFEIL